MILHPDPHAPEWIRLAATSVLATHIAAATIGLVSGGGALLAGKGGRLHRLAGTWFVVSMMVMAGIGAAVAPLLPQQSSVIAGLFTFYLVGTGWRAATSRSETAGRHEAAWLAVAVATAALAIGFGLHAAGTASGRLGGDPSSAYYILALLPGLAALADVRLIRRVTSTRVQRLTRHIWRMCMALFVASSSLFLGQPRVFPAVLRGSPIMLVPELAVLGVMVFWLVRVRKTAPAPHPGLSGTMA